MNLQAALRDDAVNMGLYNTICCCTGVADTDRSSTDGDTPGIRGCIISRAGPYDNQTGCCQRRNGSSDDCFDYRRNFGLRDSTTARDDTTGGSFCITTSPRFINRSSVLIDIMQRLDGDVCGRDDRILFDLRFNLWLDFSCAFRTTRRTDTDGRAFGVRDR